MMASCMSGSGVADAHAVSGAAGTTSAEHDAELVGAHALCEAVGMASAEFGGVLADAHEPSGLSGGHAVEFAVVLAVTAESAGADICKAAVAVASKSGVWTAPVFSRSL